MSYYTATFLVGAHRFRDPFPKLQTFPEIFWALLIDYGQYENTIFTKLQRHKKSFVFRNSVVKMQRVLFGNEPFLRKMLESFFGSNIPLYIGKNPVEKLLRFWKWNLKRTPQSA